MSFDPLSSTGADVSNMSAMHKYLTEDNLLMKKHPRFDEMKDYLARYPNVPLGSNPAHRKILNEILKHYELAMASVDSAVKRNVETLSELFDAKEVSNKEAVKRLKALSDSIPLLQSNEQNRPMERPVPKGNNGKLRSPDFYKNNLSRRILPSDPSNPRSPKKLYSCPPPAFDVEYEDPEDPGHIRYLRDYNGDRTLINVKKGQAPTCEIEGKKKDDGTFEFGEDNFLHLKERLKKLGSENAVGDDRIPSKYLNDDAGANLWIRDYVNFHSDARQEEAKRRRRAGRA